MPEASPSISRWTTQDVSVSDGSGTCPHVLPGSKPLNPPLTCPPTPTLRLVPTLCHLSALAGFLLRFCCSLGRVATLNQRVRGTGELEPVGRGQVRKMRSWSYCWGKWETFPGPWLCSMPRSCCLGHAKDKLPKPCMT